MAFTFLAIPGEGSDECPDSVYWPKQTRYKMIPANKSIAATATDPIPSRTSKRRARKPSASGQSTKSANQSGTPRHGSKTSKILTLLKRPGGASLPQLQKATGWQAHSVRGFLSGAVKKKMGLRVISTKLGDGTRTYRVSSK